MPVRTAPVFDRSNATVPLPLPGVPELMVSHVPVVDAAAGRSSRQCWSPGRPLRRSIELRIDLVDATRSWLTLNACPAIVIDPVRAGPVLATTENITVPLPLPCVPDEMEIQLLAVVAVHTTGRG
jgi:hypothetical protein